MGFIACVGLRNNDPLLLICYLHDFLYFPSFFCFLFEQTLGRLYLFVCFCFMLFSRVFDFLSDLEVASVLACENLTHSPKSLITSTLNIEVGMNLLEFFHFNIAVTIRNVAKLRILAHIKLIECFFFSQLENCVEPGPKRIRLDSGDGGDLDMSPETSFKVSI